MHTYLMVVGVDGSIHGRRALSWAMEEAERRTAAGQQTAVQAITAWQFDPLQEPQAAALRLPDPGEVAHATLAHAVSAARADHPQVSIAAEVVEGDPATALASASAGADLLVLGSHGHGQRYHAILGSIAEACVGHATCPVLIIPVERPARDAPPDVVPALNQA